MPVLDIYKNTEERRKVLGEVIEAILRGDSIKEIQDAYSAAYNLPIEYIRTCLIPNAREEIARVTGQQADLILPVHIQIYEEIYKFFDEYGNNSGKLKALALKEKLMGFHKKENVVEINNKKTTVIETAFVYDCSKLSKTENERLRKLLEKAKK